MPYQYVREPLTAEEADRLANACETPTEQLIVWTLLDTGLRVSELCDLTAKDVLWQQRQLRVRGKGGPYGKKSKVRVVPMSRRVRALLEHHFALRKEFPVRPRRAQGLVKEVANRAGLTRKAGKAGGKAGQVRYWQYGQVENSPDLAISDLSRFLSRVEVPDKMMSREQSGAEQDRSMDLATLTAAERAGAAALAIQSMMGILHMGRASRVRVSCL